ncbi:MAG: right-handed parallel beta-helix repeat-containing protein [Verrucomicrobiota bacterium]
MAFVFLGFSSLSPALEHGTLLVTDSPFSVSLSPTFTENVTLPANTDPTEYTIGIDPPGANNDGVVISTIAQNGTDAIRYPSVSGFPNSAFTIPRLHFIQVRESARNVGIADNANVAFLFSTFQEFYCGVAFNSTNGGAITTLNSSANIRLGIEFEDNADGTYTLDLTDPFFGDSTSSDGILLVNSAKDENNFALSQANSDGTFTIINHDNGRDAATYERDPVSFLYIPLDHQKPEIIAMGRIDGSGAPVTVDGIPIADGTFTVTKPSSSPGFYYLDIPGETNCTGTLILSPEGGSGTNLDNLWSYEWDHEAGHFVIASRDIVDDPPGGPVIHPATNPQHISNGTPAFSFAFVRTPGKTVYVDQNVSGGLNNGTSWSNAYTDLQTALNNATSNTEIWVAEGNYKPGPVGDRTATFQLKRAVKIYGGFPTGGSTFDGRNDDPLTNNTILSGDLIGDDGADFINRSDNTYHVVVADGTDFTTCLDGFTVSGGQADGTSDQSQGGGIHISLGRPVLANVHFTDNFATTGGAAYLEMESHATFNDCQFTDNQAVDGAGLYMTNSDPTIEDGVIEDNLATTGGSLYLFQADPQVIDSFIIDNDADVGPAAHIRQQSSPTFLRCNISANRAFTFGGGITVSESASPHFNFCTISGNTGPDSGAARLYIGAQATFKGTTFFQNNSQDNGGAVRIEPVSGDSLPMTTTFEDCLFIRNRATVPEGGRRGGAIYSFGAGNTTHITNGRFVGNEAASGGCIATILATTNITNCAFSGNAATFGAGVFQQSGVSTITNCSFTGNTGVLGRCFHYFLQTAGSSATCTNNIFWDPSPLEQNGGIFTPTFVLNLTFGAPGSTDPLFVNPPGPDGTLGTRDDDLRYLKNSPAFNSGSNSANTTTTDLAGNPRVQQTFIDRGAYEGPVFANFDLLFPNLDPEGDSNNNGIQDYLEYAAGSDLSSPTLDPPLRPQIYTENGDLLFQATIRTNADDAFVTYEKSTDLKIWDEMVPGIDFELIDTNPEGPQREEYIYRLLLNPNPSADDRQYWRQSFTTIPPAQ